jgi:hypothetical protein
MFIYIWLVASHEQDAQKMEKANEVDYCCVLLVAIIRVSRSIDNCGNLSVNIQQVDCLCRCLLFPLILSLKYELL